MTQATHTLPQTLTQERQASGVRHGLRDGARCRRLEPAARSGARALRRHRRRGDLRRQLRSGARQRARPGVRLARQAVRHAGGAARREQCRSARAGAPRRGRRRLGSRIPLGRRQHAPGALHEGRRRTTDGSSRDCRRACACRSTPTKKAAVLHFVSLGYYFDLGFGLKALAAAPAVTRRDPRRTHRSRPRLVPLHDDRHASAVRRDVLSDRAILRRGGILMTLVFSLLTVQTLLGALDYVVESRNRPSACTQRRGARLELALHAARAFVYAFLFLALAWREWHGSLGGVDRRGAAAGSRRSPRPTSSSRTARDGCARSNACCTPCSRCCSAWC